MNSESTCLLIDNSNTRTKFAISVGGGVEVRVLPTAEITKERIWRLLHGWVFARVCICSVVPSAADELSEIFKKYQVVRLSEAHARGIDFSCYPGLATLGADRIANVLAAQKYASLPLVAVDLGTASTFDVLCRKGERIVFMGGVIAPGVAAFASCLHTSTAQLPVCDHSIQGPVIGRNTQEAMSAAIHAGYPGMVDSLLDAIEKEVGGKINVVLTGGDAAFVSMNLRRDCIIVPHLTLHGIALAAGQPF